jgi:transposase InsO family protein
MFTKLSITQCHTRLYRPQTNGKTERLCRTMEISLLAEIRFESIDELKDELINYFFYYKHERPHQVLNQNTLLVQQKLSSNYFTSTIARA